LDFGFWILDFGFWILASEYGKLKGGALRLGVSTGFVRAIAMTGLD